MKNTFLLTSLLASLFWGIHLTAYSQDEQDIIFESEVFLAQEADSLLTLACDTLSTPACDSLAGIFYVPQDWEKNLDEMMSSWLVQNHSQKREHPDYQEQVPVSDSVYVARLNKLHNIIELPFNDVVRNCINLYVDRRRKSVEYMLGLEDYYFPMIEQALDENNLPDELKYLAVVESALNPTAVSRAGATGLWQFMLPAGKQYGLEINSLVDERRNPLKATYAACEYFKSMYTIYSDWNLVIAAYNCGPGNVNKAIKRAGGKTDYWTIYPYLPKETRSYVPLFIAATYVMNYYPCHQLYPVEMVMPLTTDTVMVDKQLHFSQISDLLEVDLEMLRSLNPQYKKDIIPGHIKPRPLRLPALQTYAFIEYEDTISKHRVDEFFPNRTYAGNYTGGSTEKVTHKVKKGETLSQIASQYGVAMSDIRKWNGLRSNKIGIGRNLTIYADNGGYSTQMAKASTASASTKVSASSGEYARYKVKKGDTLSTIAQRYRGYSYKDIMRINGMKSTSINVGQIIKVPNI